MGKIEWTGKTWNPVGGCKAVSPGCANCYAEVMTGRLEAMGQACYTGLTRPGKGRKLRMFTGEFREFADKLDVPLRRTKPATYFVNSMSDLFGEGVSNEYIAAVFAVMAACPQHTFQVLTKRAARLVEWFTWAQSYTVELYGVVSPPLHPYVILGDCLDR
jgi:protein gp37